MLRKLHGSTIYPSCFRQVILLASDKDMDRGMVGRTVMAGIKLNINNQSSSHLITIKILLYIKNTLEIVITRSIELNNKISINLSI